ncbi:MAG: DUF1127 domain-containing protein [Salaquimonas sp.]
MQHSHKPNAVPPILMSMLSTTISWLVNEEELNQAVEGHMEEIRRLNRMTDRQLLDLGITRDQITAYVLHENVVL